jgi:hypothetical protein
MILLPLIIVFIVIMLVIYRNQKLDEAFNETEYARITNKTRRETFADKGSRGEYSLYAKAAQTLEGETHWLFNVYIPLDNGKTTEIDAILFHASGIYVIESKNYSGWIFGTETQEKWTQCLKPSRYVKVQKYQFYNPIKQNQFHINRYRQWLGESGQNVPIYSVILFGDGCTLRDVKLTSCDHYVDKQSNFPNILRSIAYSSHYSNIQQVNRIYSKTYRLSQITEETKQKHAQDVRTAQQTKEYACHTAAESSSIKASETCPLCKGKLVVRIARRGPNQGHSFMGCSNYPNCRYTRNINE